MGLAVDLGDEDRDDDVELLELGPVVVVEGGSFLFLAFLATSEAVEEDDKEVEDDDGALGSVSSWPLELVLLDLFIFILRLGEAGAVMGSPPELTSLLWSFGVEAMEVEFEDDI